MNLLLQSRNGIKQVNEIAAQFIVEPPWFQFAVNNLICAPYSLLIAQ